MEDQLRRSEIFIESVFIIESRAPAERNIFNTVVFSSAGAILHFHN